jgi:putative membrane protein
MNTHPRVSVRRGLQIVTCVAVGLIPFVAAAQTAVRDDRATSTRDTRVADSVRGLKKVDRDFLEKTARASMAEAQISRVAVERTSNPEVKRFAQMMLEEHEKAGEQIAALASAYGFTLPAKEPHPSKWEKHDAKSFDRDYVDKMVADHQDVVKMVEKQANDGEDVETVAFARRMLPKMQVHLQRALDLKRALSNQR